MDVSPSGGGIVKVNQNDPSSYPADFSLTSGESVSLEAVPAAGYRFENWSGDVAGTSHITNITIDCNKKVTANFSRIMHSLTMQVNGSGSTTPEVGSHSYGEGTTVSITATPDIDWQFDGWTGDVTEPAMATTMVTIDSNKTVIANFSQVKPIWWLIGGIIAGVVIIGVIVWLVVRSRRS